ncbi:TPA: accessory Sec system translocase SecA2 [Streptococcus suis]|nr:accessory Sec system translocase SecA2 [Streptococcus suis]HEM4551011.1 accessory Sec system translocase SecA2 [Streptococcus suis]HEM5158102.1 accessory Sec system translocase SecA2 [Streptococcus suis]HEM5285597.1 accessory Sec system translocase SecA2 [Streptococcus suis]HEM5364054.1 accessory Sec system translocase SecA2 [Streptococcus suis]
MKRLKQFFSMDYYRLKRLDKIFTEIDSLKEKMARLTDDEMRGKTQEFKDRLAAGATLDDLLVEAYALVREADKRVLGMFPYKVQVMGAIVLHEGNIAEMKTGEGKTLTATMPLYLNALEGKGAMLITTSGYLAQRDAEEMGEVYKFLGLTVSCGVGEADGKDKASSLDKKAIYAADITYTTNSALGFDYLFENLATSKGGKYLRPFHYAIIDEADAVLLDTAQTPLIVSGSPRVQSNLYAIADQFIVSLKEGEGYYYNRENGEVWLTQAGIDEAERYFNAQEFFDIDHAELVRHVVLALQAHKCFTLGKNYVVQNNKVQLLDKTDGRVLSGTRLQGGVHQAIEQKEGVKITPEMRSIASVTYQNLFLMFNKLSGMTGTAKTAESEFIETYNMQVVQIPTNKPVIRKDYPDKIYTTMPEKIQASLDLVKKIHATGQPILLVTGSVNMSELYSELLLLEGIPHSLLNAYNVAKEAQMVAEAGQLGTVTVATNMAGRGTDIKLGPGVKELGGLAVIGTERMKSQRMDLQMRGRSGRQGDPGFSQFFACLEDDLLIENGGKWIQTYFEHNKDKIDPTKPEELTSRRLKKALRHAQEASDGSGRSSRSMTLQFDESVKLQREYVYRERNAIIEGTNEALDILQFAKEDIALYLKKHPVLDAHDLERYILDHITYDFHSFPEHLELQNHSQVQAFLLNIIKQEVDHKKEFLSKDYSQFERIAALKAIDECWVEEVDYLQQLRVIAGARQAAQRNPVFEYHQEAYKGYQKMKEEIRRNILQNILLSDVSYTEKGDMQVYFV